MKIRETTLTPTLMIEELMYFILQNEMSGELNPDHPFMDLYVELQKLLDKVNKDRHDLYVSVKNDESNR
jgi:hypothetical protein